MCIGSFPTLDFGLVSLDLRFFTLQITYSYVLAVAAGMIGNFQAINTFLIDAFGQYAASAMAAATFFRSLCG